MSNKEKPVGPLAVVLPNVTSEVLANLLAARRQKERAFSALLEQLQKAAERGESYLTVRCENEPTDEELHELRCRGFDPSFRAATGLSKAELTCYWKAP